MYIVINTGTSNTRILLLDKDLVIKSICINIGVRNTVTDGNNCKLKKCLKDSINDIKDQYCIRDKKIEFIVAYGMLSSNVGLLEIPHEKMPVKINDMHHFIKCHYLKEITDIPFYFIPGLITEDEIILESIKNIDFMRGEEVEAIGIFSLYKKNMICILPGSHNKYVEIDETGFIRSCYTAMSGEVLEQLTHNTIISKGLDFSYIKKINEKFLLLGVKTQRKIGFLAACFKVRILQTHLSATPSELQNYLLGVVIADELQGLYNRIKSLKKNKYIHFAVAGKDIIKAAYMCILNNDGMEVTKVDINDNELGILGVKHILKGKR